MRRLLRAALVPAMMLSVGIGAYVVSVAPASSDPTQPPGFSTVASVAGTSQTNVALSGPLTDLSDGSTVTIQMDATGTSAGQFFGAEARLCQGGVTIRFQSQYNPDQGGNCVPMAFDSQSDGDVIVNSDTTKSMATITFRVGVGTQTFQANSVSTVTCDAADPCALWLKQQFNTLLLPGGLTPGVQFVHFDLQFGSSSTLPSTTTTTTTGSSSTTTTTTLPPGSTTTTTTSTTTTVPSTTTTTTTTVPSTTTTTVPSTTSTTSSTATSVADTTSSSVPDPGLGSVTGAPVIHLLASAAGLVLAGALLVLVGVRYRLSRRR